MRIRKIRGFGRRLKQIRRWADNINVDQERVLRVGRDYLKINIHPWNAISAGRNSIVAEPNGKAKIIIITSLLSVYNSWKQVLDNTGEPYYLKIWLCEPRLTKSQVVCATGGYMEFYDKIFYKPDYIKSIQFKNYGIIAGEIEKLNWDFYLDEDIYMDSDLGEPEQYDNSQDYIDTVIWFKKLMKKPIRIVKLEDSNFRISETYYYRKGYLWLGGVE